MSDYVTPYSHNTAESVGEASPVATTSVNEHFANMVGKIIDTTEPRSYYEAATQPGWIEAMNKEIQALVENETWEITTLPPGRKAIGCRWVYKTKYKADGSIERKKARLVIQGCNQKQGVEYTHTYAPVAKMSTIRALLAVAAMCQWHTCQMDVQNAFLHGDLNEDIYMQIPLGYNEVEDPRRQRELVNLVCKLKKGLVWLETSA